MVDLDEMVPSHAVLAEHGLVCRHVETGCLEVERHRLDASHPHRQWIEVVRLVSLVARVHTRQLLHIVCNEIVVLLIDE